MCLMSFMHVRVKQGEAAFSSLVVMLILLQMHLCQEKKNKPTESLIKLKIM